MDELFSCRNCIHNCGQSPNVGQGAGYCLQHDSVIWEPERTTCKYLHRKDLPHFVVDEGVREHAAEFAFFPLLVTLDTKKPIEQIRYSEKFAWERGSFDPLTHALAQYYKIPRRWVLIQAFTGGADGRRSLTHGSLVRHYMDRCGKWTSSYRLVLGLLDEIDDPPHFSRRSLLISHGLSAEEVAQDALWDVVFVRLSALQEYGWHAGLEPLIWASDEVNGSLSEMNWPTLQAEFANLRPRWIDLIISHAKEHGVFFPQPESVEEEDDENK
ncbi:MAG TPA: hypothetical protein VNX28_11395 [Gemmataceae bacterium]|jgi:hypothetical protein|nr:hypothetical protein [Gemmataceae bacterium]